MAPALVVEADLDLTVEGNPVGIAGSGTHLTVTTPTIEGAITVLRSLGPLSESVEPFGSRFVAAKLSADVEVAGVVIARIGPYVVPNTLSRLLGIDPARLYPRALVRAGYRELRA